MREMKEIEKAYAGLGLTDSDFQTLKQIPSNYRELVG